MTGSMCQDCHSGCCRAFAVPMTGADILRIENRLGLDFWEFACRWADPDGTIARKSAPQFFFPDEPQTPFVICLKHDVSEVHPGTTRCWFLIESPPNESFPLGTARCGIYDSRPAACRGFPAKLSGNGDLVILTDLSQSAPLRSGDDVYELCPRPWTPQDVDPVQLTQDLVVLQYELEFFRQIAAVWNRSPRSWDVFPEFLRAVYRRRVVSDAFSETDGPSQTIPISQFRHSNLRAA